MPITILMGSFLTAPFFVLKIFYQQQSLNIETLKQLEDLKVKEAEPEQDSRNRSEDFSEDSANKQKKTTCKADGPLLIPYTILCLE